MKRVVVLVLAVAAAAFGQWSSPVPVLRGTAPVAGQALVAGSGDTVWAVVVTGRSGSSGPYQVLTSYSTGDTWSLPYEVTPEDSGLMFSEPGMGRDPAGRLWVAWYRGAYPVCDIESSAVWTSVRDSAGWHAPARALTGVAAVGPLSFGADLAGNWYMGFSALTSEYASAMFSRWTGTSWSAPRYISRGSSSPIQTDYTAPALVTRPDSGLWAAYEMQVGGSGITMVKTVRGDTARFCTMSDGYSPAATADSSGRLWLFYSQLNMYWLRAEPIVDDTPLDTFLVSDMADGPSHVTTDLEGLVWAAWPDRATRRASVSYCRDMIWSTPEFATDSAGTPVALAADATGSVYALFLTNSRRLSSVRRLARPYIEEGPGPLASISKLPATVVRGVLVLPRDMTEIRSGISDRVPRPVLLNATGRRLMVLQTGANDVSRLAPGVYFVRDDGRGARDAGRMRKVVLQK